MDAVKAREAVRDVWGRKKGVAYYKHMLFRFVALPQKGIEHSSGSLPMVAENPCFVVPLPLEQCNKTGLVLGYFLDGPLTEERVKPLMAGKECLVISPDKAIPAYSPKSAWSAIDFVVPDKEFFSVSRSDAVAVMVQAARDDCNEDLMHSLAAWDINANNPAYDAKAMVDGEPLLCGVPCFQELCDAKVVTRVVF